MKSVASSAAAFVAIFTFALLLPRCNAMLDIDAEPNLVAADSGTADSAPNDGGDDSAPDDGGDGDDAVGRAEIVIAYNPWLASKLNAIVAQTLLQSQLGLDVDIAEHDEYTQWGLIANDEVDACLEVWPSGHTVDIKNYIDTGKVELGGFLGPVGKIGWYLPTYVMDEHPELASWEGLLEPGNADLFKVNPADAKGRFVGGDATWVEYDDQIIANLNLPLKLEYVGSEEAILSELDTAYASNKPILFYFWTPHWALQKYNLSTMALKEYSDECYAKASSGGVDCDYPEDRLLKILSPVLKGRSKQAYSFFKSMTLTNQDQIQMMAKIEIDGMTDVAAAQWWIGENQSKWGSWIVP